MFLYLKLPEKGSLNNITWENSLFCTALFSLRFPKILRVHCLHYSVQFRQLNQTGARSELCFLQILCDNIIFYTILYHSQNTLERFLERKAVLESDDLFDLYHNFHYNLISWQNLQPSAKLLQPANFLVILIALHLFICICMHTLHQK